MTGLVNTKERMTFHTQAGDMAKETGCCGPNCPCAARAAADRLNAENSESATEQKIRRVVQDGIADALEHVRASNAHAPEALRTNDDSDYSDMFQPTINACGDQPARTSLPRAVPGPTNPSPRTNSGDDYSDMHQPTINAHGDRPAVHSQPRPTADDLAERASVPADDYADMFQTKIRGGSR